MLRLVADENLNQNIMRGLLQREPELDLVSVQEATLAGSGDPEILEWAAHEGRIMLTHDENTLIGYAYRRVRAGESMPGVIVIRNSVGLGSAIEDILLLAGGSFENELEGRVIYLPIR